MKEDDGGGSLGIKGNKVKRRGEERGKQSDRRFWERGRERQRQRERERESSSAVKVGVGEKERKEWASSSAVRELWLWEKVERRREK